MAKKRFRAQIVGATGYGGLGMTEQLLRHPEIEIAALLAKTDIGKPISDFFPHLRGFCDRIVEEADDERVGQDADVVMFCTPDRVSMQYAPRLVDERACEVLDYLGRLPLPLARGLRALRAAPALGQGTAAPLPGAAGRERLRGARAVPRRDRAGASLVGNPGCFSVAMELGLAPALRAGIVDPRSIIVDGKTGVSGAGKKPSRRLPLPGAGRERDALPRRRPPARGRGAQHLRPLRRRRRSA